MLRVQGRAVSIQAYLNKNSRCFKKIFNTPNKRHNKLIKARLIIFYAREIIAFCLHILTYLQPI